MLYRTIHSIELFRSRICSGEYFACYSAMQASLFTRVLRLHSISKVRSLRITAYVPTRGVQRFLTTQVVQRGSRVLKPFSTNGHNQATRWLSNVDAPDGRATPLDSHDAIIILAGGQTTSRQTGLPEWVERRLDLCADLLKLQKKLSSQILCSGGGTPLSKLYLCCYTIAFLICLFRRASQ